MRQQRHGGLGAHERLPRLRGVHGDVRELFGIGLHFQAAVREQERPLLAQVAVGHHHDEERADQLHARRGLEDLQAGAQHVARGMACAGHHAVGAAGLHHHHAEVQHVVHEAHRRLGRHPLGLAQLVERLGEPFAQLGRARVDDARTAELVGAGRDGVGVAEDDEVGDVVGQDALGRRQGALVVAFGQHDRLAIRFGAGEHRFQE